VFYSACCVKHPGIGASIADFVSPRAVRFKLEYLTGGEFGLWCSLSNRHVCRWMTKEYSVVRCKEIFPGICLTAWEYIRQSEPRQEIAQSWLSRMPKAAGTWRVSHGNSDFKSRVLDLFLSFFPCRCIMQASLAAPAPLEVADQYHQRMFVRPAR
jgi:hypothetical protein